jgi:hypothetical protein
MEGVPERAADMSGILIARGVAQKGKSREGWKFRGRQK